MDTNNFLVFTFYGYVMYKGLLYRMFISFKLPLNLYTLCPANEVSIHILKVKTNLRA